MKYALTLLTALSFATPMVASAKPVIHDQRTGRKGDQILYTRTLSEGAESMKIEYFQIAREDMASQAINRITMKVLNRYSFPCGDGKDASEEGVINLADRNAYTVSLAVWTSWFCGAYPDSVGSTNTYELKTGRRIKIANEFVGDAEREKVKQILFAKFKKEEATDKDADSQCADVTGIELFDLNENSFGVVGDEVVYSVFNTLPHAVKACGNDVKLKIKDIAPLLKKDSILLKLVK